MELTREETKIIDTLTQKMIAFDQGEPELIQHFLKVHRFAQLILRMENANAHTSFVTQCAAVLHDIGILPARKQYGYCNGKLQEEIGPKMARPILEEMGFAKGDADRICYLIGHHHTYTDIDGLDYQILIEADFLVNFFEENHEKQGIERTLETIFKTASGRQICRTMFGLEA